MENFLGRRAFLRAVAASFALPLLPGSKIEPDKFIMPETLLGDFHVTDEAADTIRKGGFYAYTTNRLCRIRQS